MTHARTLRTIALATLTATAAALAATPSQGMQPRTGMATGVQDARTAFQQAFPGGSLIDVRGQLRRAFGVDFSHGASPHDSVEAFMRQWSVLWGVPFSQLEPIGPFEDGSHEMGLMPDENGAPGCTAVYWRQQVRGVPVFRSYAWGLAQHVDGFPMPLAGGTLKDLGSDFPASLEGRDLGSSTMDPAIYASQVIGQFQQPPVLSSPRYVIWAGIDSAKETPRLAVEFTATSGGPVDPDTHQRMQYVVDAADGTILHQESLIVHGAVSGTVNMKTTDGFKADACNAEVSKGMPYGTVVVAGNTFYADANGAYSATFTGTSASVAPNLSGRYFRVIDAASNPLAAVSSQVVGDGGTANFTFNNTPAELQTAQVNTYYAANQVRDMVLAANASYPTIYKQVSFPIYTNIASTCNAYYDGSSINFFTAGGGCNNTGFSTVVHHEFGHHVVACGGSGQAAYGEGMGDVMSLLMSDESALGVGFFSGNCTSGIRNASNSCSYDAVNCSSCGSEIHACGQLISGVVWDIRNSFRTTYATTYRTRVANLAVNSVPLHAGQSDIASDIAADYLTLDDAPSNGGNGVIADGTPNYNAIAAAFNRHQLAAPSIALLLIEFPNALPTSINPDGTQTYDLTIRPVSSQIKAGSQKMFFREGTTGSFTALPLQSLGGTSYRATFPASTCKSTLQFYFQADSTGGTSIANPSGAPGSVFSATSQISSTMAFSDDFEATTTAFTVAGNVGPSKGAWMRVLPSTSNTCNGPNARAGSVKAFVTGALTSGCNDIDAGYTELLSPVFDASGAETLVMGITTFLSNDTGANPSEDPLTISVSNDGGTNWTVIDRIYQSHNWTDRTYRIDPVLVPSSAMRLKVRAEDLGAGDSQVKAGVDDVWFESTVCTAAPFGDLDGDRVVGASDLAVLLLDFGPCVGCPSDLDGSGVVDGGDVALLLLSFTS
jgi:hypothetical protein